MDNYVWSQLSGNGRRELVVSRGNSHINVTNNLLVIPPPSPPSNPGLRGDMISRIGVDRMFTTPLYWSLSEKFLGDRAFSYNGYLRFMTSSDGQSEAGRGMNNMYGGGGGLQFTDVFPLVQLVGNYRIIIEHYPRRLSTSGRYEVRLTEDQWVMHDNRLPVTRDMMMVALQNVQQILVRATDTLGATHSSLGIIQ